MSTRVDGATVLILVSARATLSAGSVHVALSASDDPAPGTWRYNLHDGQHNRAAYGPFAGKADHIDVLRYAAGICDTPGTATAAAQARILQERCRTARPDDVWPPSWEDWPSYPPQRRTQLLEIR